MKLHIKASPLLATKIEDWFRRFSTDSEALDLAIMLGCSDYDERVIIQKLKEMDETL